MRILLLVAVFAGLIGCPGPSHWKVHGGPAQCVEMCTHWGLQFAAMVGVGDQAPTTNGATACVCVPPAAQPGATGPANAGGATAATLAGPIVIAAAQAAYASSRSSSSRRR